VKLPFWPLSDWWDKVRSTYQQVPPKVSNLQVTWFSSPEWHNDLNNVDFRCVTNNTSSANYTVYNYSWVPGCIDRQNIDLAKKRAQDTERILREEFAKHDISLSNVDAIKIGWRELQFSEEEVWIFNDKMVIVWNDMMKKLNKNILIEMLFWIQKSGGLLLMQIIILI
jgi:hypothetical protein